MHEHQSEHIHEVGLCSRLALEMETGGAVEVEILSLPPVPARAAPPNRPFSCVRERQIGIDQKRGCACGWVGGGGG